MRVVLYRYYDDLKQTLGTAMWFNDMDSLVGVCNTLELPWVDNQNRISCIPPGDYNCTLVDSPHFGPKGFYHVTELDGSEVKGRQAIGVHRGNYNSDVLGCILVGTSYSDLNADKELDIQNSSDTFAKLVQFAPVSFVLQIRVVMPADLESKASELV
jgi:hypothetical protein